MQKAGGAGHLQRVTFWCEACQPSGMATLQPVPPGGAAVKRPAVGMAEGAGQRAARPAGLAPAPSPAGACAQRLAPSTGHPPAGALASSHTTRPSDGAPALAPPWPQGPSLPQACCNVHGRRSLRLKRVRKTGHTAGRLFFSCQASGCNFFAWADAGFPRCNCQQAVAPGAARPASVLRVSKKEGSGGRWFFSCGQGPQPPAMGRRPNSDQQQEQESGRHGRCNFFAWATPAHLEPLGPLLTPLL